ncbi:MAG: hypothetical protein ACRCX2_39035 [Paraclostridium sp.]
MFTVKLITGIFNYETYSAIEVNRMGNLDFYNDLIPTARILLSDYVHNDEEYHAIDVPELIRRIVVIEVTQKRKTVLGNQKNILYSELKTELAIIIEYLLASILCKFDSICINTIPNSNILLAIKYIREVIEYNLAVTLKEVLMGNIPPEFNTNCEDVSICTDKNVKILIKKNINHQGE